MVGRIVRSRAPARICDLEAWLDTKDFGPGDVLNIAIGLYAHCEIEEVPSDKPGIFIDNQGMNEEIHLANLEAKTYESSSDIFHSTLRRAGIEIPKPLAIGTHIYNSGGSVTYRALRLRFWMEAPPGSGLGSSAAMVVAVMGAAAKWVKLEKNEPGFIVREDVASEAHLAEEGIGINTGVQDHQAAAMGGINFIEVHEYPRARAFQVRPADETVWELETRLVVAFIPGENHFSSAVHADVIAAFNEGKNVQALKNLRGNATRGRECLMKGDLEGFGAVMNYNWEQQKGLHPKINSPGIERLHEKVHMEVDGFKPNGAAGGGTVTLLCKRNRAHAVRAAIAELGMQVIPVRIDWGGLRVWEVSAR